MRPTRGDLSRIRMLAAVAAATTVGLLCAVVGPAMAAGPAQPYMADSFYKSRVENAPIDAARTTSFRNFMATNTTQKAITWPKINTNASWAMSYAYGKATDPIWKL